MRIAIKVSLLSVSALLAGCFFESKEGPPSELLRLDVLNKDIGDEAHTPEIASIPSDSGFAVCWRSNKSVVPEHDSIVVRRVFGDGRMGRAYSHASNSETTEPRISAFPDGSLACAWSEDGGGAVKILEGGEGSGDPIPVEFPGLYGLGISILALPDKGFVVGGQDRSEGAGSFRTGVNGIMCRRYRAGGTEPDKDWIHPCTTSASLEFAPRPGGGWFAFWGELADSVDNMTGSIHWQAFEADGTPVGAEHTKPVNTYFSYRLLTQTVSRNRVLVQVGSAQASAFFLVGPDGETDTSIAYPGRVDGNFDEVPCSADLSRCYGAAFGYIERLVSGARNPPRVELTNLEFPPVLGMDARGRLIMVGLDVAQDPRHPGWFTGDGLLKAWIVAPF